MRTIILLRSIAITMSVLAISSTRAATAIDKHSDVSPPIIYVGDFEAISEETSPSGGALSRLRSLVHAHKADESASALSRAIARELNAQGSPARYLPANAPRPAAGWLVNGVFYALTSRDPLLKLPFLDTAPKGPNTEVTVNITNLAVRPDVPFAVIGTDYRLKGQGSAVSWNPYIVAAKFVVNKIEASKSIDALANQIVAEIIAHRSSLAAHDPAAQHR